MTDEHRNRKFQCRTCEDWGTILAPDGRGTLPCPEPIHRTPPAPPAQPGDER